MRKFNLNELTEENLELANLQPTTVEGKVLENLHKTLNNSNLSSNDFEIIYHKDEKTIELKANEKSQILTGRTQFSLVVKAKVLDFKNSVYTITTQGVWYYDKLVKGLKIDHLDDILYLNDYLIITKTEIWLGTTLQKKGLNLTKADLLSNDLATPYVITTQGIWYQDKVVDLTKHYQKSDLCTVNKDYLITSDAYWFRNHKLTPKIKLEKSDVYYLREGYFVTKKAIWYGDQLIYQAKSHEDIMILDIWSLEQGYLFTKMGCWSKGELLEDLKPNKDELRFIRNDYLVTREGAWYKKDLFVSFKDAQTELIEITKNYLVTTLGIWYHDQLIIDAASLGDKSEILFLSDHHVVTKQGAWYHDVNLGYDSLTHEDVYLENRNYLLTSFGFSFQGESQMFNGRALPDYYFVKQGFNAQSAYFMTQDHVFNYGKILPELKNDDVLLMNDAYLMTRKGLWYTNLVTKETNKISDKKFTNKAQFYLSTEAYWITEIGVWWSGKILEQIKKFKVSEFIYAGDNFIVTKAGIWYENHYLKDSAGIDDEDFYYADQYRIVTAKGIWSFDKNFRNKPIVQANELYLSHDKYNLETLSLPKIHVGQVSNDELKDYVETTLINHFEEQLIDGDFDFIILGSAESPGTITIKATDYSRFFVNQAEIEVETKYELINWFAKKYTVTSSGIWYLTQKLVTPTIITVPMLYLVNNTFLITQFGMWVNGIQLNLKELNQDEFFGTTKNYIVTTRGIWYLEHQITEPGVHINEDDIVYLNDSFLLSSFGNYWTYLPLEGLEHESFSQDDIIIANDNYIIMNDKLIYHNQVLLQNHGVLPTDVLYFDNQYLITKFGSWFNGNALEVPYNLNYKDILFVNNNYLVTTKGKWYRDISLASHDVKNAPVIGLSKTFLATSAGVFYEDHLLEKSDHVKASDVYVVDDHYFISKNKTWYHDKHLDLKIHHPRDLYFVEDPHLVTNRGFFYNEYHVKFDKPIHREDLYEVKESILFVNQGIWAHWSKVTDEGKDIVNNEVLYIDNQYLVTTKGVWFGNVDTKVHKISNRHYVSRFDILGSTYSYLVTINGAWWNGIPLENFNPVAEKDVIYATENILITSKAIWYQTIRIFETDQIRPQDIFDLNEWRLMTAKGIWVINKEHQIKQIIEGDNLLNLNATYNLEKINFGRVEFDQMKQSRHEEPILTDLVKWSNNILLTYNDFEIIPIKDQTNVYLVKAHKNSHFLTGETKYEVLLTEKTELN